MIKDKRIERIQNAAMKLVSIIDNEFELNDKELDLVIGGIWSGLNEVLDRRDQEDLDSLSIGEPDDYDESVKHTRASRESRFYEGTVSARTLSGLFRSLKNKHPNTTVAKQFSGMIWRGDVVLHIRNAGWNESGDWIELGFSLSPDKSQLSVYETKSGKKEIITSVNQFQEALESLGVRASVIDSITRYL